MNYRLCFAAHLRRQGKNPATIRTYTRSLAEFASYCRLKTRRVVLVKNLNPHRLESYRDFLKNKRGLRPSTVNGRLTALSGFARFLLQRGMLDYNPLELVERLKIDKGYLTRMHTPIDLEKVQALRQEVHMDILDVQGRLIVELLYSGMTVREICSLPWHDQERDVLRVDGRSIKLHRELILAMKHHNILRSIQRGGFLIAGNGTNWSLKPGSLYRLIKRLGKKLNVTVAVRDLRLARFAPPYQELPSAAEEAAAA